MNMYIVAFQMIEGAITEFFVCKADDVYHAIEQTEDAYPNCGIQGVFVEVLR